jgi:hypothetical protein
MSYLTRDPRRGIGSQALAAGRRHDAASTPNLVKEAV